MNGLEGREQNGSFTLWIQSGHGLANRPWDASGVLGVTVDVAGKGFLHVSAYCATPSITKGGRYW